MRESSHWPGQRGYAMIALLVAMSVMGVALSVILPMWQTMAKREREAELVFRGEQYARAIALFQRKYGNANPPTVDALVRERFLRKKYTDPVTDGDFVLLGPASPELAQGLAGAQQPAGSALTRAGNQPPQRQQRNRTTFASARQPGAGTVGGGIVGVTSASSDDSFREYNGRTKYNQWLFLGTQMSTRAGARGGANVPGLPGRGRGIATPGNSPMRGRGPGPTPFGRGRGARGANLPR